MTKMRNSKIMFNGCDLKDMLGLEPAVITGDSDSIFGTSRSIDAEMNRNKITSYSIENDRPSITLELIKRSGVNVLPITDIELDNISRILFTKDMGILQDGDRLYYGWFVEGSSFRNLAKQGYITLKFELASPYVYTSIYTDAIVVSNTKTIELQNVSTSNERLYMDIELVASAAGNVTITNLLNGNEVKVTGLLNGEHIVIDGESREIYSKTDKGKNMFTKLSYSKDFPYLEYGTNRIKVDGNCEIQFKYQCQKHII